MAGDLPPNSSVTGVRFSAAARMTTLPMVGEPVNTIWLNGKVVNLAGSVISSPKTATSSSLKTSASMRRSMALVFGVISGSLIMTRLPAANAAMSGPSAK